MAPGVGVSRQDDKPPGERARTPPAVGLEIEDAARERQRPPCERVLGTPATYGHEYNSPAPRVVADLATHWPTVPASVSKSTREGVSCLPHLGRIRTQ